MEPMERITAVNAECQTRAAPHPRIDIGEETAPAATADRAVRAAFIDLVARDVARPIALIPGATADLKKRCATDPAARALIAMVDEQLGHLEMFAALLADLAKLECHAIDVRRTNVKLSDVVDLVVGDAELRGAREKFGIPPAAGHSSAERGPRNPSQGIDAADRQRLASVAARVRLSLSRPGRLPGFVRLQVLDEGDGIDPQRLRGCSSISIACRVAIAKAAATVICAWLFVAHSRRQRAGRSPRPTAQTEPARYSPSLLPRDHDRAVPCQDRVSWSARRGPVATMTRASKPPGCAWLLACHCHDRHVPHLDVDAPRPVITDAGANARTSCYSMGTAEPTHHIGVYALTGGFRRNVNITASRSLSFLYDQGALFGAAVSLLWNCAMLHRLPIPVISRAASVRRPSSPKPLPRGRARPPAGEALAFPWEKWGIFLHTSQKGALVERPFAGPTRVAGSAGTGKTIVARSACSSERRSSSRAPGPPSPGSLARVRWTTAPMNLARGWNFAPSS